MAKRQSNRLVRKAIRELMEPEIAALGFAGKYPEFRRSWKRETHFLYFSTRKYGGGFSYSGAWCKSGPFRHWDDRIIPEEKVEFVHTDWDNRASAVCVAEVGLVHSGKHVMRSVGDFDYSSITDDAEACRDLVRQALLVLSMMDRWLKTREPGLGIDTKGHRMRTVQSRLTSWHFAMSQVDQFSLDAQMPLTPGMDRAREAGLAPEYFAPS